jgi:hypothetical protein
LDKSELSLDFELPEVLPEDILLMKNGLPITFREQLAHAQMFLKWKGQHLDSPPRNLARFELE